MDNNGKEKEEREKECKKKNQKIGKDWQKR